MTQIPITMKVVEVVPQKVTFKLQMPENDCLRCKTGQGCGNLPWFRGVLIANKLTLPLQDKDWQIGDMVTVKLLPQIMSLIAVLLYGLPLFVFILGLFFCQHCPEVVQFLISIIATGSVLILSRPLQIYIIKQFIFLEKIETCSPTIIKNRPTEQTIGRQIFK